MGAPPPETHSASQVDLLERRDGAARCCDALLFESYTAEQLRSIVRTLLDLEGAAGAAAAVALGPTAVELRIRQVAKESGDCRQMVRLCEQALMEAAEADSAEEAGHPSPLPPSPPSLRARRFPRSPGLAPLPTRPARVGPALAPVPCREVLGAGSGSRVCEGALTSGRGATRRRHHGRSDQGQAERMAIWRTSCSLPNWRIVGVRTHALGHLCDAVPLRGALRTPRSGSMEAPPRRARSSETSMKGSTTKLRLSEHHAQRFRPGLMGGNLSRDTDGDWPR